MEDPRVWIVIGLFVLAWMVHVGVGELKNICKDIKRRSPSPDIKEAAEAYVNFESIFGKYRARKTKRRFIRITSEFIESGNYTWKDETLTSSSLHLYSAEERYMLWFYLMQMGTRIKDGEVLWVRETYRPLEDISPRKYVCFKKGKVIEVPRNTGNQNSISALPRVNKEGNVYYINFSNK